MPEILRRRRLLALAALAFVAFLAVYLLAVQTEPGQRVDEAALTGGREVPQRAQDAADRMLRTVSISSLVLAIAGLSGIAFLRRDPVLVLLPAAVIGLSLVATEIFKVGVLERPQLTPDSKLNGNSYPSGHTTVFASIGLALLLVVPAALRAPAALLAAAISAAAGIFVVTADWHRPSDPIGSFLLTLAVAAAVAAVAYELRSRRARRGAASAETRVTPVAIARGVELAALATAVALFLGALLFALLRYGPDVDWNRFHAAYLAAAAAIVLSAGLMVGLLLRALGPPPGAERRRRGAPEHGPGGTRPQQSR